MKKFGFALSLAALMATTAACTRIETGEVGIRRGMDKQIQKEELVPGSLNQTIFGDVLTFPVKDVQVDITDLTPLASDNSTIKKFDVTVVYNINPSSVAEIYIEKSRGFHITDDSGDIYLMYNYIAQLGRNAAYKVARNYESLKLADNRAMIEQQIRAEIIKSLKEEKLDGALNVSQILVRSITPADNIVASANNLVKAQNEQKQKEVEVRTAKLEAERIAALNANRGATEYMAAMAMMNISEGIKDGKVQTIIVPQNFNGMLNIPTK